MPRDSRRVRQLRRLKRERTSLTRMLDHVLQERNMYRGILEDARKKYTETIVEESKKKADAQVPEAVATE